MLFCIVFTSFSQSKSIEKGTYLSTNKGQTIKLNFLEGNKYELVLSSGEYKVKGDSLLFSQNKKEDDAFNLTFKNDRKAKKIKIKFLDTSYYPFYIGTQKGAESVQYQRLSDIKTKVDPEFANADLEFDIDRTDYLYLVVEGYETETKLYKYALPKDVSEVTIKYDFDIVEDLKIFGFFDKKPAFEYYFDKKLKRANVLYSFNKIIKNKKATDADLILAFNNAAVTELPYDYESDDVSNEENSSDFKLVKVVLDKKEVSQIWKKLIEGHQKDTKPNMFLVETILKEIKNQGFSKQFFKDDRVLNDTDFLSIDYLIKHYNAIEKANAEVDNTADPVTKITNLSSEISSALQINSYVSGEGVEGNANQNKIISIYKKLIAIGKGGFECYKNYFAYLSQESEGSTNNTAYLKEFNAYFNTYLSSEKGNAIEKLDEMYTAIDPNSQYSYDGWNSFKDYHSNLCNSAAWAVVLKPANSGFMKDAINWSEYSLIVTKNNPYYLDTLAQLYYKDGQKDKAIITQELAVKFLNMDVEEQTASEIRETLTKMQNGTY